jgi:hypothetical protein
MATTKDELVETVMLDVGDRPGDSAVKALYYTWFDDTLDIILARWPWFYRREVDTVDVVSVGFTSFAFPATVSEVRSLRLQATSRRLDFHAHDELMNLDVDLAETGTPQFWYYLGYDADDETQMAGLYPRPSEDLTLEYDAVMQIPLPLSAGASIPVPREALGVLREGIRAFSYENEAQPELANAAWSRFMMRLERLAASKGFSRPEKRSKLREDGDLAHLRQRDFRQRLQAIPAT